MAENKKDSFTFSDKIKNSKPAFNPFSKRMSSKIGSNGKPKKTIFERTRRDAPFFVAAAAALLMLPFLYKYSGTVEEGAIITPGSESSIFDPYGGSERMGPLFDDPNGQIAQLTGRDSLSLIKGWGDDEESSSDDSLGSFDMSDRDGLNDNYTPSRPVRSTYRSSAPAQTRAAFQRQATKIKELGSASMNVRGGGGVRDRFGGANLKSAAKQNSAGAPKKGAKPVSLQPLRAAGKPSRSYFGQGGAAQARASRAAMGKGNALQALNDAMFRPVDSARPGGFTPGDYSGPGGAGKIDRHMDFKGITPWWWDMMKDRSQKMWEWKYFLWRKNLVEPLIQKLGEMLGEFGFGLGCCLLTGEDDCSMGSMWGTSGESYSPGGCKINKVTYQTLDEVKEAYPGAPIAGDLKKWCESIAKSESQSYGAVEWVAAKGGGGNLGFFGKRAFCLGATVKGRGDRTPGVSEKSECQNFTPGLYDYHVKYDGKAADWHRYIYVVARNYVPEGFTSGVQHLCDYASIGAVTDNGATAVGMGEDTPSSTKKLSRADRRAWATNASTSTAYGRKLYANYAKEGLSPEEAAHGCVIYIKETKTGIFDYYRDFQRSVVDWLIERGIAKDTVTTVNGQAVKKTAVENGKEIFNNLDLFFVESVATKKKLASGNKGVPAPGVLYKDFEDLYLDHVGTTATRALESGKEKKVNKRSYRLDTRKEREGGKNMIRGAACYFSNEIELTCGEDDNKVPVANVAFKRTTAEGKVNFTAQYYSQEMTKDGFASQGIVQNVTPNADGSLVLKRIELKGNNGKAVTDMSSVLPGNIEWKAYRGGVVIARAECPFKNNASEVTVTEEPEDPVTDPCLVEYRWKTDSTCCKKVGGPDYEFVNGQCLPKAQPPVPGVTPLAEPVYVTLANKLADVPVTPMDRSAGDNGTTNFGTGLFTQAQLSNCADSLSTVVMKNSTATKEFVEQVIAAYNQRKAANAPTLTAPIENGPSVAQYVDALNIAAKLNLGDIAPKRSACVLGRSVAGVSKDTIIATGVTGQNGRTDYTNPFGSFLVYITPDASSWPATHFFDDNGLPVCNPRTLHKGTSSAVTVGALTYPKCDIDGTGVPSQYHWGAYNHRGGPDSEFVSSSAYAKPYPLAALQRPFTRQGTDAKNRGKFQEAYNPVIRDQSGDEACSVYEGNMSPADVLVYMQQVCTNGLNIKPHGTYDSSYEGKPGQASSGFIREGADANANRSNATQELNK